MHLPNAIIGGAGRAGSTSLFRYLTDHPEVCGSSKKETQFFINHIDGSTQTHLNKYAEFFSGCADHHTIRIEATPHYLQFADQLAPLIHKTLPGVKLLFILREPVSRLFTGFRNLRELESQTYGTWNFDTFVEHALSHEALADHHAEDPRLRAASYLHTGCYSKFLNAYYKVFDPEQIQILFFDNLTSSTKDLMLEVARFLEIDESFYDTYAFSQENRTRAFRSRYMHRIAHQVNQSFEPILNKTPILRRSLRRAYNALNESRSKKEMPTEKTRGILESFYQPHNVELDQLLQLHGYSTNLPSWLQR